MAFTFQQPGSAFLLRALDVAAAAADSGVAMFAFASAGGVKAFFELPGVAAMLAAKKPFHLVVGLDAITNAEAVLCIEDVRKKFGAHFTAEAFFHEHPASTFHPKFVQFSKGSELRLVTGSGNLTARGLGLVSGANTPPGNWEAFTTQTLTGAEAKAVAEALTTWVAKQRLSLMLRPLGDEKVRARAMANGLIRYATRPKLPRAPIAPIGVPIPNAAEIGDDDFVYEEKSILLRELPRNRPGQADVGKTALSEFFGYDGTPVDILLQHVTLDNVLGNTESIRLFVNESQNYRLELHAMGAVKYKLADDDSRMILVATRLDQRSFRYTIVTVDSPSHGALVGLLGAIQAGRRFMREKRITGETLAAAWTEAPSNLIPVISESPAA